MKIDSTKILNGLKIFLYFLAAIAGVCLLAIPLIYLKRKNKKILIHPEFTVVDVDNSVELNQDVLSEAVRLGKEMMLRMEEVKKK